MSPTSCLAPNPCSAYTWFHAFPCGLFLLYGVRSYLAACCGLPFRHLAKTFYQRLLCWFSFYFFGWLIRSWLFASSPVSDLPTTLRHLWYDDARGPDGLPAKRHIQECCCSGRGTTSRQTYVCHPRSQRQCKCPAVAITGKRTCQGPALSLDTSPRPRPKSEPGGRNS